MGGWENVDIETGMRVSDISKTESQVFGGEKQWKSEATHSAYLPN